MSSFGDTLFLTVESLWVETEKYKKTWLFLWWSATLCYLQLKAKGREVKLGSCPKETRVQWNYKVQVQSCFFHSKCVLQHPRLLSSYNVYCTIWILARIQAIHHLSSKWPSLTATTFLVYSDFQPLILMRTNFFLQNQFVQYCTSTKSLTPFKSS